MKRNIYKNGGEMCFTQDVIHQDKELLLRGRMLSVNIHISLLRQSGDEISS